MQPDRNEKDWTQSGKPGWKHPYIIYILLTLVLFLGLVVAAALALNQGWITQRV